MQSRSLLVWLLATMHGRRHALSDHDLPEELLASIFHCAQQRTCLKTCMLSGPNGRLQVVPPCSLPVGLQAATFQPRTAEVMLPLMHCAGPHSLPEGLLAAIPCRVPTLPTASLLGPL